MMNVSQVNGHLFHGVPLVVLTDNEDEDDHASTMWQEDPGNVTSHSHRHPSSESSRTDAFHEVSKEQNLPSNCSKRKRSGSATFWNFSQVTCFEDDEVQVIHANSNSEFEKHIPSVAFDPDAEKLWQETIRQDWEKAVKRRRISSSSVKVDRKPENRSFVDTRDLCNEYQAEDLMETQSVEDATPTSPFEIEETNSSSCDESNPNSAQPSAQNLGSSAAIIPESNILSLRRANLEDDFLNNKENWKCSSEQLRAEEEEWQKRELEIMKQSAEAKKLKMRVRAEQLRTMEMEKRQQQRLQEIRLKKEEEEQQREFRLTIQSEVQRKLENLTYNCPDMATLFNSLGIQMEGGDKPTQSQVQAAYKRALFKFHPDRVATQSKNDFIVQVEAEEIFKLISKMKSSHPWILPRPF